MAEMVTIEQEENSCIVCKPGYANTFSCKQLKLSDMKNILCTVRATKYFTVLLIVLFGQSIAAQPPVLIKNDNTAGIVTAAGSIPDITTDLTVSDANPVNGKGVTPSGDVNGWAADVTINYTEPLLRAKTFAKGNIRMHWQVSPLPFTDPKSNLDFKNVRLLLDSGSFLCPGNSVKNFHINLMKAANNKIADKQKFYIRIIPLNPDGTRMVGKPSPRVLITYVKPAAAQPVLIINMPPGTGYNKSPGVITSLSLQNYLAPVIKGDPYQYILTKIPPDGEMKKVLEKMNVKTPGQKFRLAPDEYEKIKKNLSLTDQAGLVLNDFWQLAKDVYNWIDNKYNYVENAIVDKLAPVIGRENARSGINYFKSIYGMKTSYGNFDEAIGYGEKALTAYIEQDNNKSDAEKSMIKKYVGEFITMLKKEANGGDDPNRYYRQNPEYAERPALVILSTKYTGINNPPATMKGGKRTITIKVYSGKATDQSTLLSNGSYPEYPEVLLFEKTTEVPDAKPGEIMTVPVFLDYSPLYKTDQFVWLRGYNAGKPGRLEIDGITQKLEVAKNK